MSKEVILTGLRSNAEFHLGNYLGAIKPMVELQKKHAGKYQLNMFIPDLHSFTTPVEHGSLYQQSLANLRIFVAAGLDINQPDTFIYRQSYIPAHSELTWILDCFSGFGELLRMTQFKEKGRQIVGEELKETSGGLRGYIEKHPEALPHTAALASVPDGTSVGLFNYPVLMASDILLYGARWVPVGEDQRQHVEFARELANRMNNRFKDLFTVPEENAKQVEFAGRSEPVRIRSLRTPEKKMSKSVEDPAGTIMLSDNPDDAAKKIMSATTDSLNSINYDWQKQPGVTNLLQILALFSGQTQDEVNKQWQGQTSYGELKQASADQVGKFLKELQEKLAAVDENQLMHKLEQDEQAMTGVAGATLLKVQKAVGLRPSSLS